MTFVGACLSTWQAYLTGGAVQAIVNVYERQRGHGISWETYRWGVFAFSLAAFFVIWRKEHSKVEALQEVSMPDVSSLREALIHSRNDTDRQREEIARLNEELGKLRTRSITDAQRKIIVAHITPVIADYVSAGRQLQVTVNAMPSSDCAAYARDFEELLSSVGLAVYRYPKPSITYIGSLDNADDLRIGVTVLFNPERFRVPYPQALIAGLEEAGIKVNVLERDGVFFNVIIGDRA